MTEREQTEHYLGGPTVNIRPYEPIIQEAINELQSESPGILNNVTDINVDLGYGQFGSVSSDSPSSINLNMLKLKDGVKENTGQTFSPYNKRDINLLKFFVKQTIIHETSHISDFDPETQSFPGGEGVAQRTQEEWVQSNPAIS